MYLWGMKSEFWEWVAAHAGSPATASLAEQARKALGDEAPLALTQIEGRRKAAAKLRKTLQHNEFMFPSTLLAEQCTDERVAAFNASAAGSVKGKKVLDLTFGLGIDAFAFARAGASVTGVERYIEAVEAGRHNAAILGLDVRVVCDDALDFLQQAVMHGESFDLIYLDPARRDSHGGRVYNFADCEPRLDLVLEKARQLTDAVLVKGSPMVDVSYIFTYLSNVKHVWAVGLNGECKEVLVLFGKGGEQMVSAVDIGHTDSCLNQPWSSNRRVVLEPGELKEGLLLSVATAAMEKAQPWQALHERWPELQSAARGLFVSAELPEGFPGRVLRIDKIYTGVRQAARELKGEALNVAVYGYPMKAEALRSKLGVLPLSDDSRFLIGTSQGNRKLLLLCHKE